MNIIATHIKKEEYIIEEEAGENTGCELRRAVITSMDGKFHTCKLNFHRDVNDLDNWLFINAVSRFIKDLFIDKDRGRIVLGNSIKLCPLCNQICNQILKKEK